MVGHPVLLVEEDGAVVEDLGKVFQERSCLERT
jgi:hypothetical protein